VTLISRIAKMGTYVMSRLGSKNLVKLLVAGLQIIWPCAGLRERRNGWDSVAETSRSAVLGCRFAVCSICGFNRENDRSVAISCTLEDVKPEGTGHTDSCTSTQLINFDD
jgi:hypothetical protein